MQFTKETITALTLPPDKADYLAWDDDLPGFGIRLRAGGKRVWVCQYRALGRQRRETLGDVRKVDLKAARAAAQRRFAEVTLGGDPQAEKALAKERAALRVGPIVDKYLERQKGRVRPNTYVADYRYLKTYWRNLHGLSMDAVSRRSVASRLSEILTEHGVTAAARARGSLNAFFAWAMCEGLAEQNPVIGTAKGADHERTRDRVLSAAELKAIWLSCLEDDFGRIVRMLMLTAARRDEIGGLRWSEVNLDVGTLEIPGTRTKNHHPLRLTLPAAAVDILRSAPRREGRDLIFGGGPGPYGAWSYATLMLRARIVEAQGASIAPWRLHDLRRTAVTGMAELGVQPHIVETVINHRGGHKSGVAGVYNRATYDTEVKRALAVWADHLLSIVEGAERKVLPLRQTA